MTIIYLKMSNYFKISNNNSKQINNKIIFNKMNHKFNLTNNNN